VWVRPVLHFRSGALESIALFDLGTGSTVFSAFRLYFFFLALLFFFFFFLTDRAAAAAAAAGAAADAMSTATSWSKPGLRLL